MNDDVIKRFNKKFLNHTNEFINPWIFRKSKTIPDREDLTFLAQHLTDFLLSEIKKVREEVNTDIMNELIEKAVFVTYKKDNGHGKAVPVSEVIDLLG